MTETGDEPDVGSRKSRLAVGTVTFVWDCIEAGLSKATEVGVDLLLGSDDLRFNGHS